MSRHSTGGARVELTSGVDPDRLALYRHTSRAPDARRDERTLRRVTRDHGILVQAGDVRRGDGAAMTVVDVVLRMAATPSPDSARRECKRAFVERRLPAIADAIRHPQVAGLARAALDAELAATTGSGDGRRDVPGRKSPGGTTTIARDRLDAYEEGGATAAAFGDVQGLLTAIVDVTVDLTILRSEGLIEAADGADRMLDACVRRLCAATASSSAEAGQKAEVLACLKRVRYAGEGLAQGLMAVMLDAAVEFETERWAVRH